MSKYPSLPNSELLHSKMTKLQGLEKYLLWSHTDVIEALNLEKYNFLKNLLQNASAYQIFTFYLEKYQSYKALHVSHYDVIMTSYKPWIWKQITFLKKTGQNNPCHQILTLYIEKHQSYKAFVNYPIMTSYWWRHRSFEFEN